MEMLDYQTIDVCTNRTTIARTMHKQGSHSFPSIFQDIQENSGDFFIYF